MKKLLVTTLILVTGLTFAQNKANFGLKAGLNYNANGDYFESVSTNAETPDRNIGWHVGVYGQLGKRLYFRPELVYTNTKSDYNSNEFTMKKLDMPLLFGVKVLGPINVFGGPALQYILDTDFGNISINNVENDFTIGLNFGIGASFNKFGLDLRYERGLSENEATFVSNIGISDPGRLDTRPDQLILSLSVNL